MLKIMPGKDRLYVQLDEVKEKVSKGGITLPDKHSERTRRGTVMAVGEGVPYKVGDRVLVSYTVGIVVDDYELYVPGGQEIHRVMTTSEVLATLEE